MRGVIGGRVRSAHSRGAVHLRHYLSQAEIDAAPPMRDWRTPGITLGMFANDRISDCTIASLFHRRQLLAALTGEPFAGTEAQAIADYSAVTGYDGTPDDKTDNGAQMIDVLTRAANVGIAGEKIAGFARVDPLDAALMRAACNLFGPVYVGAELPRALDEQGKDWDLPPIGQRTADDEPDPTRGHAFLLARYDRLGWNAATWAADDWNLSNAWAGACIDEAWVLIDDAFVRGDRPAPNGFNLARLQVDLAALAA